MMKQPFRKFILLYMLWTLASEGCSTIPPSNSPQPTREQISNTIHKISMVGMYVSPDVKVSAEKVQRLGSLIKKKFIEAGFTVIPSNEYDEIWARHRSQTKALFDPITGKPEEQKINEMKRKTVEELKQKFDIDTLVFSAVQVVKADYSGGKASWDGVEEYVYENNGFRDRLKHGDKLGATRALSLFVRIEDIQGEMLYEGRGGIQLLSKILTAINFVDIPNEEILANPERNAQAVNLALDPLFNGSPLKVSQFPDYSIP